jgi:hypothetical protein
MIEDALLNYGAIGLFCIYLIYDKKVLMNRVIRVLDRMCHKLDVSMYEPKTI